MANRKRGAQYRASVTSKGQVVIPAELRKKYGITDHATVVFQDLGGGILVSPITDELIRSLRGIAARPGMPIDPEREPDLRGRAASL
jgi:AbrB family looped-hinge helix DNA binding protein